MVDGSSLQQLCPASNAKTLISLKKKIIIIIIRFLVQKDYSGDTVDTLLVIRGSVREH